MYLNSELHRKSLARAKRTSTLDEFQSSGRSSALRIDFVVRPGSTNDVPRAIGILLEQAGLDQEGLQSSVLLVSDREARVVSLLTLWDSRRFDGARERLTSWTLKLVADFADGPVRASTGVANFFTPEAGEEIDPSSPQHATFAEPAQLAVAG